MPMAGNGAQSTKEVLNISVLVTFEVGDVTHVEKSVGAWPLPRPLPHPA